MHNPPVTLPPLKFNYGCERCLFYRNDPDMDKAVASANLNAPKQGVCVRFPPSCQLVGTPGGPMSVLVKTVVPADHWCGEFKSASANQ